MMAWGSIACNYKSPLYRFNLKAPTPELRYVLTRPFLERAANGINGPKYAEWVLRGPLLDDVRVLEGRGRHPLVQEDNAPIHNNEYCDKTELGLVCFPHPPTSPDLNPIENAWFELQSRLADMQPRSRRSDDFWVCCGRAWDDIPMDYINKLVEGMPRCLEAVQRRDGWPTRY